jgi:uncharacterized protein YbjQ (UPF0145 family)
MLITTTFDFEGYRITEYKGLVRGIVVRAPTIPQGIAGGLKNLIGGRIGAYTEMCEQARQQAYDEMLAHANRVGANAIVGVRYDASEVVSRGSATEVLCYGTAVVVTKVITKEDRTEMLAQLTRRDAESGAAPNGGPVTPVGHSGIVQGPPSVS